MLRLSLVSLLTQLKTTLFTHIQGPDGLGAIEQVAVWLGHAALHLQIGDYVV